MSRADAWEIAIIFNDRAILDRTPVISENPFYHLEDEDDN